MLNKQYVTFATSVPGFSWEMTCASFHDLLALCLVMDLDQPRCAVIHSLAYSSSFLSKLCMLHVDMHACISTS